eukprot:TRINITY_DN1847_c0_g1_i10.p1 TRINITY_DN1847_c0_g1~~TRINITY_DN1847_c0_g1_i10.p1  ORF type:complete len:317 (-),score=70.92 TRINITY_DN1847_c0_g1_i10:244-1194(-)
MYRRRRQSLRSNLPWNTRSCSHNRPHHTKIGPLQPQNHHAPKIHGIQCLHDNILETWGLLSNVPGLLTRKQWYQRRVRGSKRSKKSTSQTTHTPFSHPTRTHTIHNTPLFVVLSLISPKLRFFASFVHYFFPYLLVCTSTSNQPSFTTTTSLLGMSQPAQPNFDGPTPKDKFVQETLEGYSDGDVEFAKTLITSYIGSVEEHLPLLKESFKEPYDKEGAILHSHDIKGSSAYIGAEAVRFLSGKIEFLLRHDKLQEAKTHYDELDKEVKDVFKILEDYMKEHGGSGEEEEEEVPPKEVPKEEKKPERVPAAQAIKG